MIERRLAGIAALVAYVVACSATPDQQKVPIGSPAGVPSGADPAAFRTSVNAVFERRCGSLDCHGTNDRGMRIYSANGLRLPNDAGFVPGTGTTSPDEINGNYASIVGLQPEKLNAFLAKSPRTPEDAYELIVLAKPLLFESHKGGPALSKGEPGEQCIVNWLIGTAVDQRLCDLGSKAP